MTEPMTAVKTALTPVRRMYALNSVPKKPDYPYGTFSASFGRPDGYGLDATHGIRWCTVVVQAFGRTVDSLNDVMEQVTAALLDKVLTIDGWDPTPIGAELDPTRPLRDSDDEGVLSSTATFTFTATPLEA